RAAELADALGDHVGDVVDLSGLFIEQEMIVAEMRARDVPVKVLGLDIQGERVGQERIERSGDILRSLGHQVRRRVQWRFPQSLCILCVPCFLHFHRSTPFEYGWTDSRPGRRGTTRLPTKICTASPF